MLCIFSQKDSLTVIPDALVEQTVKQATVYDKFQFERIGFFSVDPDSSKDKVSTPLSLHTVVEALCHTVNNWANISRCF